SGPTAVENFAPKLLIPENVPASRLKVQITCGTSAQVCAEDSGTRSIRVVHVSARTSPAPPSTNAASNIPHLLMTAPVGNRKNRGGSNAPAARRRQLRWKAPGLR